MGYSVVDAATLSFEERPAAQEGVPPRQAADLTPAANLQHSRARLWRYPPGARGRRHAERVQEEVFVVVAGTLTMLLGGDDPERVDVGQGSVVSVEPGTPLQIRNEAADDLLLFAYGSPPEQAGADFFDEVELPPRS